MYIYVIIIIVIVIILFILFIINKLLCKNITNNVFENFNDCLPDRVGYLCRTDSGFGICSPNNECIKPSPDTNTLGSSNNNNNNSNNGNEQEEEEEEEVNEENISDLDTCIPNQDFDKACKSVNPKFGVKKIIACKSNSSAVECSTDYINGIKYGDNIITTPCMDKYLDFDLLCKYYNNSSVPPGQNIDNINAQYVLNGSFGGCYLNNGESNTSKSRAICNYNYYNELPKLNPEYKTLNYNTFTDCYPIKDDFVSKCSTLLNSPSNDVYANEIMAYDCNPGYARAKCIKKSDKPSSSVNPFTKNYGKEDNQDIYINDDNECCNY
jgi:hypothetical protein